VRATARAKSGNARATCFAKGRFCCGRVISIALFVRLTVRSSFPRAGAVRRRILLLAAYTVTRRCWQPASHVHPFVRAAAAVDLAKSIRLDRTPIPTVCSFYTIAKRIHVLNNTVYNARTRVNQFDVSGSKFIAALVAISALQVGSCM
jgi:hypothetical protein